MSTTILYRPSDKPNAEVWNLNVEHQVFADGDVAAALEAGWVGHPADVVPVSEANPETKSRGRAPKEA